jgi:hypothetical protein
MPTRNARFDLARRALPVLAGLGVFQAAPCLTIDPAAVELVLTTRRDLGGDAIRGTATSRGEVRRGRRAGGTVRLRLSPRVGRIDVLVLLLHEIVHLAMPENELHGATFRRAFAAAAAEAWHLDLTGYLDLDGEGYQELQDGIAFRLFWRSVWLRVRAGWAWVLRRRGRSAWDGGAPADHLLLG